MLDGDADEQLRVPHPFGVSKGWEMKRGMITALVLSYFAGDWKLTLSSRSHCPTQAKIGLEWATRPGCFLIRTKSPPPILRFHSQLPEQERINICAFLDLLGDGFAGAVAGFGFDSQQDGALAALAVGGFGLH